MDKVIITELEFSTDLDTSNQEVTDYVVNHPNSRIYHLAGWCRIIERVFKHKCYYFVAKKNREIVGVLPVVRQKSKLFGDNMISMPYFTYGGPLANSEVLENLLMEHVNSKTNELGLSYVEYREFKRRDGYAVKDNKISMMLDLPGEEELWSAVGSKIRAQIKRPLRLGVISVQGKIDSVDQFYDVMSENMRDLGTPFYSKKFFQDIVNEFEEYVTIQVVYLEDKPVGAALVIHFNGVAEIPWASTLRSYNRFGINMYMYWEVLKGAIEAGCKEFDFGRSSKDSGTYRFKKQWGAVPVQLYWNYWLGEGVEMPAVNPDNPKYKLVIACWKKSPLFITNWLGPKIARSLP